MWRHVDTMGALILARQGEVESAAAEAMRDMADEILDYAQSNAPWADRTGDAREGLVVEVSENNGEAILTLAHTVDYGLWLEVIQGGRFATIMPTLETFADQVFRSAGARVTSGEEP